MIRGLYTSAIGMMTQMNKLDVVSNNVANADTTSYKGDVVITQSFSEELAKRLDDPKYKLINKSDDIGGMSLGVFVDEIKTNFKTGSTIDTDSNLDLAIIGEAFFAVNVKDKKGNVTEKYTRDGSFALSENGSLVTKLGDAVLGQNGEIKIPNGNIFIDQNGNVYSNEIFVDRINLVEFEDNHTLRKSGDKLYDKTNESKTKNSTSKVLQSHLEASNINPVKEMIEIITLSRNYEANQKMVQTFDTILGKAVNEIGRK